MGFYIETGIATAKADQLVSTYDAEAIDTPNSFHVIPEGKVLICVVQNGPFDAAAVCYNESEFEEFSRSGDPRPRTWLLMERDTVLQLVPNINDKHQQRI